MDRKSERPIPEEAGSPEPAGSIVPPESKHRSGRWLDIKEIAKTAFVPSIVLAGVVSGGVIAGTCGVVVGGMVGFGVSAAAITKFPGIIR